MALIKNILLSIPFFRHFSEEELSYLQRICRVSNVKKNQLFDLKKTISFNVILNGMFEIEVHGKKEVVYMAPGSFFGKLPFSNNKTFGKVRAVIESTLLIFDEQEIYKLFLISWKSLRGYIKAISKMGFDVSDVAKMYYSKNSRIITVYSPYTQIGKSFYTSLLGLSVSKHDKTIVLDLAYKGNSIFNFFDVKLTSPVSQKQVSNPSVEKVITDRIEAVEENLDVMNISFGSKVKVDPDIISPILFILSKTYRYIIIDLSDFDNDLRSNTLNVSDIIFCFVSKKKEMSEVHDVMDSGLRDGQRVYYMLNEYTSGVQTDFEGGLILEKYDISREDSLLTSLKKLRDSHALQDKVDLILEKKRALVLETNLLNSVFYSGFFNAISKKGISFNIIYSSSFSFIITALYLLSSEANEFRKRVLSFFSEDKINSFLDITFPEEYVFKKNNLVKYSGELCRNVRIENFRSMPIAQIYDTVSNSSRLFSTGYLKNLLVASFLIHPLFEPENILSGKFCSGNESGRVRVEELLRTDTDEIIYLSVNNKEELKFRSDKVLNFYTKHIHNISHNMQDEKINGLADKNLVIEVMEKDLRVEKIMESSEEISEKLLKDKKIS